MATVTLNQVMRLASGLPGDDKQILIEALKRQRAEEWRMSLAKYARKAEKDFQAGKLKAESAKAIVARMREEWAEVAREK